MTTRHLKVTIEVWALAGDSDPDRVLCFSVQRAVEEACAFVSHDSIGNGGLDSIKDFVSSEGVHLRVSHTNDYRDRGVPLMNDLRDWKHEPVDVDHFDIPF